MKTRNWLLILSFITLFSQCEREDICDRDTSSSTLVVGFYNLPPQDTLKYVRSLYLWAPDKDSIYIDQQTDSIVLPLDFRTDATRYFLSDSIQVDTFDIYYDKREVYISRACGYRFNFVVRDTTTITHHWINSMEITEPDTENEQIHIRLYH